MYLAPLNCFLHDPLGGHAPIYDVDPGSTVLYVGKDRKIVRETVPENENDQMYSRIEIPLLELGVQELATLAEDLLLEAARTEPKASGGDVRTMAREQRIVTGFPEFVGRLVTSGGRSGLLIYNVGAVGFA